MKSHSPVTIEWYKNSIYKTIDTRYMLQVYGFYTCIWFGHVFWGILQLNNLSTVLWDMSISQEENWAILYQDVNGWGCRSCQSIAAKNNLWTYFMLWAFVVWSFWSVLRVTSQVLTLKATTHHCHLFVTVNANWKIINP